jgi:hypothetical protein
MLVVESGYRIHSGESMPGLNAEAANMARYSNFAVVKRQF